MPDSVFLKSIGCRGAETPKGNGDTLFGWVGKVDGSIVPGGRDAERQWRPEEVVEGANVVKLVPGGRDAERQWRRSPPAAPTAWRSLCRGAETPKGNGDSVIGRMGSQPIGGAGGRDAERQWRHDGLGAGDDFRSQVPGAETPKANGDALSSCLGALSSRRVPGAETPKGNGDAAT